jgi:hypothetical protein
MTAQPNQLQESLFKFIIREADPSLKRDLLKHKLKTKNSLLTQSRGPKENLDYETDKFGRKIYKFQASGIPEHLKSQTAQFLQSKMTNKKCLSVLLEELGTTFEELAELIGLEKDKLAALNPEDAHPISASMVSSHPVQVSDLLTTE